jgi:hypothetical protein
MSRALLRCLGGIAAEYGIGSFVAEVLAVNRAIPIALMSEQPRR